MNQADFLELARLLSKLGAEVEVSPEEAQAYLPDISNESAMRDFYLPRVPKGFYDGCFSRLRNLTFPTLRR